MTINLKGEADLKTMTFTEKVKFYTSLCLGITAVLSVFVFLFLIPFVVDPSITTIFANFDPTPVVCTTVQHIYAEGISNCTWASCKEGCTSITPRCHQLYVNYSKISYDEWKQQNIPKDEMEWAQSDIKFFINTDGCGYPPRVNCSEFAKKYGWYYEAPLFYPCYYSKHYPQERVVAYYDWNDTIKNLSLAIGIPNILFALSIGILTYWYCWPTHYDKRGNCVNPAFAVNGLLLKERDLFLYEDDDGYADGREKTVQ